MHVTPDCSCWGSRVVSGIKLSFEFNPVTTLAKRVKQDTQKSARRKVRKKHGRWWTNIRLSWGPKHAWFAMKAMTDSVRTICRRQRLNFKWRQREQQAEETCVNALSCGSRSSRYFPYRKKGDLKDYRKAVDALNAYLALKVDTKYARHCFRQLIQAPGETIR